MNSFNAPLAEFRDGFAPRPRVSHAVFDFDGTLSWLRHGWPGLMCRLFLSHHRAPPEALLAEILSGNGLPSIFQMRKFVERAQAARAEVPAPEELLRQYQSRLDLLIAERCGRMARQAAAADEFVVFGARAALEDLRRRGLKLYVLSGTLQERVRQEADLLDLARYFEGRIFGSSPDSAGFSKRAVLEQIMAEENIGGENLLCLGDGPVEIRHARELGALAVAVASDENENGSGRADPLKRAQLIEAGAQVVIADYRGPSALMDALLHE